MASNNPGKYSIYITIGLPIAIPIIFGIVSPGLILLVHEILGLTLILLPFIILTKLITDWSIENVPIHRIVVDGLIKGPFENILGTPLKLTSFPTITVLFISIYVLVWVIFPIEIVKIFAFYPYGEMSLLKIIGSYLFSSFFHLDSLHILTNMVLFWSFGSCLENRIGSEKFLIMYLICVFTSQNIVLIFLFIKSFFTASSDIIACFHAVGPSGAISGLLGLFVIRCYFVKSPVSASVIPIIKSPIKWQSNIIIGILFAINMAGSMDQLHSSKFDGNFYQAFVPVAKVNYWSHIGGYFTGVILALIFKFYRSASEEALIYKAQQFSENEFTKKEAEKFYIRVIEKDPYNKEALMFMLKRNIYDEQKTNHYFCQLIEMLTVKDIQLAGIIVEEFFPKYLVNLKGNALLRLGIYFLKRCKYNFARVCLDMAVDKDGPWKEKALFKLSFLYEQIENYDHSLLICKQLINEFSDSPLISEYKEFYIEIEGLLAKQR